MNYKLCTKCDTEKSHAEFSKTKSGNPISYCKECYARICRERRHQKRLDAGLIEEPIKTPKTKTEYIIVPKDMIKDKRLTHGDLIVYLALLSLEDFASTITATQAEIANQCRMKTTTICHNLKRLEKFGFIASTGTSGRVRTYFIYHSDSTTHTSLLPASATDMSKGHRYVPDDIETKEKA